MKLSTIFNYNQVQFDKDNEVILMASLKAPKTEAVERAPLNLSLVLDTSGSMAGEKLQTLKKSVAKVIDQMSEKDSVGIVAFSDYIEEVFSPSKMSTENKEKAKASVGGLRTHGCTNMSGGMLKGFEQLKSQDCPSGTLHRVLLFTDGQANVGLQTKEDFNQMVTNNTKDTPHTVSCFGYGTDHSEELLRNIGDTGRGNFYYISNVEELPKTFALELGGLLSCYAQNISVTLEMKDGSGEFVEILNDLTVESTDSHKVKIIFDDLYSEEERHLLVKTKLSKVTKAVTQRESTVVTGQIHYNDMYDKGSAKHANFKAKIKFVKEDEVQKDPTLKVTEQLAIIEIAKAHQKARVAADAGNFVTAQAVYGAANSYLGILRSSGSRIYDSLQANVANTCGLYDAQTYTADVSRTLGSTAKGMSMGRCFNNATDLFANTSQVQMEEAFKDKDTSSSGTAKESSGTLTNPTVTLQLSKKRSRI